MARPAPINSPLYHCNHCKKIIPHIESLLFVETGSPRGFCSEGCIEKYYVPLAQHYAQAEQALRAHHGAAHEECLKHTNGPRFIDQLLTEPNEIWRLENGLKEEIFAFIRHMGQVKGTGEGPFSMIGLCTVFSGRPSFILLITATSHPQVLKEFQIGEKISDPRGFLKAGQEEGPAPKAQSATAGVEHKKSVLLAELLERHSPADIPMDDYPMYDQFMDLTLDSPDEVYSFKAADGDMLFTYIKAHSRGGVPFYYFVVCLGTGPQDDESMGAIPILGFRSIAR